MHYLGVKAVDDAIASLGVGSTTAVLDVGSGLGGPARQVPRSLRIDRRITRIYCAPTVRLTEQQDQA